MLFRLIVVRLFIILYIVTGSTVSGEMYHDAWIMARTARGEAEILGEDAVECVMWVIYNRMNSPQFPNTVKEVVIEGDFGGYYWYSGVLDWGTYNKALTLLQGRTSKKDPTSGSIYVFGKGDIENYGLPQGDLILTDGNNELHFMREIDWVEWRKNRLEKEKNNG